MNVHFKNIPAAHTSFEREAIMNVLVFKTNLRFKKDIQQLATVLNNIPGIIRWNVDREDVDHVLRIEATQLLPCHVIEAITNAGYFCEELPD